MADVTEERATVPELPPSKRRRVGEEGGEGEGDTAPVKDAGADAEPDAVEAKPTEPPKESAKGPEDDDALPGSAYSPPPVPGYAAGGAEYPVGAYGTAPGGGEYGGAAGVAGRGGAPYAPGGEAGAYGAIGGAEYAAPVPPPTTGMVGGPTGLTPEVDVVLDRIFASGLFERRDIDGRALDFLASVGPELALLALEDIQLRDFSTVRNKPAFIMSIFKKVISSAQSGGPPPMQPPGGFAPTSVPASALAHLPPPVSDALQRVFTSGVCHPSQFDDRAMDILVDLHEADAVRALSEFAAMEPGRVRNPSAFWMGLARKYKGQARAVGGRMGPPPGYDMGYGAGPASYGAPPPAYGAGPHSGMPMGGDLGGGGAGGYSMLDQRLEELMNVGALPRNALDDRATDALRRLSEQDALAVLAELPEPSRVRNMSAYVMGLCKKFASGEARSLAGSRGGGYGGGYGPPSGSYGGPPGGGYGGPPGGGYGGTPPSTDPSRSHDVREALELMDASVRDRFYSMTERGMISEGAFDARAVSALQNMRREEACAALDELAASDPGRIHNISAYFMGLAKKFGRPPM